MSSWAECWCSRVLTWCQCEDTGGSSNSIIRPPGHLMENPLIPFYFLALLLYFYPLSPHLSISLFLSQPPTFHISCIVPALLGCHTEQDEKPGKQLSSCTKWQEESCVNVCVCGSRTVYVSNKAGCILLCVLCTFYRVSLYCMSECYRAVNMCVVTASGVDWYIQTEKRSFGSLHAPSVLTIMSQDPLHALKDTLPLYVYIHIGGNIRTYIALPHDASL